MRATLGNFLYFIKQIVTGRNGDDTPVAGGLLPGSGPNVLSSEQSADGGIKVDQVVPLSSVTATGTYSVITGTVPAITDSTGGTASTTFAAITAGSSYAQADMVAVKNALSEVAAVINGLAATSLSLPVALASESSVPAIATASGTNPAIGTFSFAVPRDYDEASDHLAVYLESNSTNTDAAITITGTATIAPIASQLATSTAIVATTNTAVTATAPFSTVALDVTKEVQVFMVNLSGYGLKRNDLVSIALAYAGTTTGTDYVYSVFRHYDSTIVSYHDTDATDDPTNDSVVVVPYTGTEDTFGNPLR